MADHWMQERQNKAEQYRLKAPQRYSNFAAAGHDLPLLAFTSRHNDASQSIGYSKSLMVFHMLRNELGDKGLHRRAAAPVAAAPLYPHRLRAGTARNHRR